MMSGCCLSAAIVSAPKTMMFGAKPVRRRNSMTMVCMSPIGSEAGSLHFVKSVVPTLSVAHTPVLK